MAEASGDVCQRLAAEELAQVFRFLSPEEAVALCAFLDYRQYPAGSIVIREHDPGDFMAFLVRGRLEARKETSFPGKFMTVAVFDPGTMVGEMAVIHEQQRSATVVARDDAVCLVLGREAMDELLVLHPALGIKILKRMLYVLSLRLKEADERLSWLL
ncbi:MAG: cyclic nucleotide-binding domain-containing protein [Thermodesulfobacteriota bacterium]